VAERAEVKCVFAALLVAVGVWAQSARLGDSCDLNVLGDKSTTAFLAFDKELRDARSRQDPGIAALLVRYPLRVNDGRGSWSVPDARSLEGHFQEIFPTAIRSAVLDQRPRDLACSYMGVMYGNGAVWVNRQVGVGAPYLVETVNLPSNAPAGKLALVCETSRHRVIVDNGADGAPRYRAWNKPHSLTDRPDLEIAKGTEQSEGTGPCRHSIWTFTAGATSYVVQELGCQGDSDEPPKGATGKLEVGVSGKTQASWWCR
jgi:hypothetical protein